jgi:diguanylate cyclase (GGDEF)-like protein
MRGLLQYCCILTLAFLACAPPAHALQPDKAFDHDVIDTWSIEDGLPQISAVCLAQDRTGYVWVGTQGGLARFDGVRFITYTPRNEPALAGVWIRTLLVDRRGRMWIGTYKGLAVYQDGRFTAVPAADARRYPTLDISALAEQADGSILAGSTDGVFRVHDDRLQSVPGPQPALSLLSDGDSLWVGSTGSVERIVAGSRVQFALPLSASSAAVSRLARVGGKIWAGTSQGLFSLDAPLNASTNAAPDRPAAAAADGWAPVRSNPAFDRSPVTAMLTDHDGNLWVGSNAGLARFRDGGLAEFVPDTHPPAFRQVISAMEDREGNLWLGSQLNGLARVWNGWTRRYSKGEGLHDPIVWSLAPDPDGRRVWVGTNDGLSLFDHDRFQLMVPGKALPHPNAYNLLAERDQVWVGTRRGLVLWRDGKVETLPELAPLASAQINGIVRAGDGSLWVASSDGVFRLHEGRLQRFGQAQGLRDPRVRTIRFLDDGRILLGTQGGLFELRDGVAHPLGLDTGLPPDTDVSALYVMRDGRLVVGTLAETSYIEAGGRWHELGPAQGLPANSPFFIVQDDRYLWLAGIRGITRVPVANLPDSARGGDRPLQGELVLNERGDPNAGQQGYCCNGAGMSKGFLRGNALWLPSRDGVVALDTTAIVKNPLPPSLLIERVHTARGWRDLATRDGAPLALPADARDLGFEFTALSFQDPRSVQLRYRLRGYDRAWHRVEDPRRRSANYTNLPPGDYAFEVIGANNAGVWSRTPAILRFQIAPFFHETWLFRWLLAALLAAMLYAGYRYQLQRHQLQRGRLETEVQTRTRELHAANARLEKASQTDLLTGLRNRRYLANQIPADLAYYDRETHRSGDYGQVVVFALVAIDGFGHVRDSHGGHAGDQLMQQFSQVLASLVRSGDYLARWGGEEFLLVFRPMHNEHLAMIGERICTAIAAHRFQVDDTSSLQLTCSAGLAGYPLFNVERQPGWEQMVDLAEAALYWARRHGNDGWAGFRPAPGADAASLLQDLQGDVDSLIASGRLQVLTSKTAAGQSFETDGSNPVHAA